MVQADLAKSNGEARRLVKQGAVRIDDERVSDERTTSNTKRRHGLAVGKTWICEDNYWIGRVDQWQGINGQILSA